MTAGALLFALDLSHGPWEQAQRNDSLHRAVARTLEIGRLADASGIESLWVSEDPDGWDALAVLGAIAARTGRIRLGTGVVNPFYRHPSLIAASLATLDALSGGRAFLGLGRGQTEWYRQALRIDAGSPLAALEETFHLLRQWWATPYRAEAPAEATAFPVAHWRRAFGPVQEHPPIYLAAVGPKALDLAARHADGVIFNDLSSQTFMEEAIARVRHAAAAAGRDPAGIAFLARAAVTVTDDPESVYERRKATVAMIHTLPGMERLLATPGYDIAGIIAGVRRVMRTEETLARGGNLLDLRSAGDLNAARRLIPTDLMAELVVAGPAAHVRARLAEFAAIGITHVFLAAPAPNATADSLAATIEAVQPHS
ncbi:MAG: LLM class flavin-dependent oxidoreductase [Chloroflexia bacterium]|nr:LLM class flavin-dependent oxidoreductase [Chloroflexia bacterium]